MLLAAAPAAWGGALDDLKSGSGAGGAAVAVSPAAGASAAYAADNGDIVYTGRRAPVTGLEALPDETSPERPPAGPERLPVFDSKTAGVTELPPAGVDPGNAVPGDLEQAALAYYLSHGSELGNTAYLGVIDFSRHSSQARFHVIDMRTGAVRSFHVAHGEGSDPDNDGYPTVFSNLDNSHASSLGFYLTGATYSGDHGRSMRLHGLSETNSNAYERAVVIHSANYVQDREVKQGRSWGCPAVSAATMRWVLQNLGGGVLIYAGLSAEAR